MKFFCPVKVTQGWIIPLSSMQAFPSLVSSEMNWGLHIGWSAYPLTIDREASASNSVRIFTHFNQMCFLSWNLPNIAVKKGDIASFSLSSAISILSTRALISVVQNLQYPCLVLTNSKSSGFLFPLTCSSGISISYLFLAWEKEILLSENLFWNVVSISLNWSLSSSTIALASSKSASIPL